ncbi:hypothetical protein LOK82_13150 [Xylella fastidiosa subsp. multiplex]|uniref:Uncharacterized protein n=1 Tax=Xylella fastidiosa subsp. multiplex TaxID=644357 RepID=A0AAW6HXK8_XYLFS|nr:hypothetical protein [Xylella fastidiosa subsp. multiplex]
MVAVLPLKNGVPSDSTRSKWNHNQQLTFLEKLIKQLVKHESLPLTPRQEREISEAIAGVMAQPSKNGASVLCWNSSTPQTKTACTRAWSAGAVVDARLAV